MTRVATTPKIIKLQICRGSSLVERRPEKAGVASSILAPGTIVTAIYDNNGNLTNDSFHNYTWDADGPDQLKKASEKCASAALSRDIGCEVGFDICLITGGPF